MDIRHIYHIVRKAKIIIPAMNMTPSISATTINVIKLGSPSFSMSTPFDNTFYAIIARMIATIRA